MARFNIEMLGSSYLDNILKEFPERLERQILRKALRDASKSFAPFVQRNIPLNKQGPMNDWHYGWWKSTVTVRAQKRKRNRVGVNIMPAVRESLALFAGHEVLRQKGTMLHATMAYHKAKKGKYYYPAHVEFGHKNARGGGRTPAYPYMGAVLRDQRERMLAIIRDSISNEFDAIYKNVWQPLS